MSRSEIRGRRLGLVGAGKLGTTIARGAIAAGYDVAMSRSGAAERIALTVEVLAPGARAATTDEVVRHADLIVLAVPTHRFRELPGDPFAGKILLDAMNYWEPVDGVDEELAKAAAGDDRAAVAAVMQLIDRLGVDAVDAGPLEAGLALEPDGSAFGIAYSADELANLVWPEASSA